MRQSPASSTSRAQFHQLHSESSDHVAGELIEGLTASSARISPKFFYDELGSSLFAALTLLPEYYPTRTEKALMAQEAQAIAEHVGEVTTLIDLGAADCVKGEALIRTLTPQQYVPVDISVAYLKNAVERLQRTHPSLDIVGVGMDFFNSLTLPESILPERRLFFYPGSSIGNLTPHEAQALLSAIRAQCRDGGGLLIGVDRVKDPAVLTHAYDDDLGVTAAFNLNILRRVNDLLGSDFDCGDWQHVAEYDGIVHRIDMYLEARSDVVINWPAGSRPFRRGERIHTESSYKYTPEAFTALLEASGFARVAHWTDPQDWFSVFSARA